MELSAPQDSFTSGGLAPSKRENSKLKTTALTRAAHTAGDDARPMAIATAERHY